MACQAKKQNRISALHTPQLGFVLPSGPLFQYATEKISSSGSVKNRRLIIFYHEA